MCGHCQDENARWPDVYTTLLASAGRMLAGCRRIVPKDSGLDERQRRLMRNMFDHQANSKVARLEVRGVIKLRKLSRLGLGSALPFLGNKARHIQQVIAHFFAGGGAVPIFDSLQHAFVLSAGLLRNTLHGDGT
jgi:hypothetical protein